MKLIIGLVIFAVAFCIRAEPNVHKPPPPWLKAKEKNVEPTVHIKGPPPWLKAKENTVVGTAADLTDNVIKAPLGQLWKKRPVVDRLFYVVTNRDHRQAKFAELTHKLVELVVDANLITIDVGSSILTTFGIEAEGRFIGHHGARLTVSSVGSLIVQGWSAARARFVKELSTALHPPPGINRLFFVAKALLELLLDNDKISMPNATKLTGSFGLRVGIQGQIFNADKHKPEPVPLPTWLSGKSIHLSIVTIVSFNRVDAAPFVNQLFELLFKRKLIDEHVVKNLLATVGIAGVGRFANPEQGATVYTQRTLQDIYIRGNSIARGKFLFGLHSLLIGEGSQDHKVSTFVKILLELVIDNVVLNPYIAKEMAIRFNVKVTIKYLEGNTINFPQLRKIVKLYSSVQVVLHKVTITVTKVDLTSFINRLLSDLIEYKFISIQVAHRLLATFKIKGSDKLAVPAGVKPYNKRTITTIIVGGKPVIRRKLITSLLTLLNRPPQSSVVAHKLAEFLLEFILDNDIPENKVLTVVTQFGIKVTIERVRGEPKPKPVQKIYYLSYVTISNFNPSKLSDLINKLLETLVKREVIDVPTAQTLLVTVDVTGTGQFSAPHHSNPLVSNTIHKLTVHVNKFALRKFRQVLHFLVGGKLSPVKKRNTLVKALLEVLIDSKVFDDSHAKNIAKTYEVVINVRFAPARLPKPAVKVIYVSYVSIVTDKPDLPKLINRLFELLVEHNVIDIHSVHTLLVTFKVQGSDKFTAPPGTKPLSPDQVKKTVTVTGNPVARRKFYQVLTNILKHKSTDQNEHKFVTLLLELLIDNQILNPKTASELTRTFGVTVTVKFGSAPKPAHPTVEVIYLTTVTITTSSPDNLGPFINKLLELLVKAHIVDTPSAQSILATINVPGTGPFAKPLEGKPLTPDNVKTIKVRGDQLASKKFIQSLIIFLKNKPAQGSNLPYIAKTLLELLIDNNKLNPNSASELAKTFKITITLKKHAAPVTTVVTMVYLTKVTIVTSHVSSFSPVTSAIIDLLIKKNILPINTVRDIIVTFGVSPESPLKPKGVSGGKPLTPESVLKIVIHGHPIPAKRFIHELVTLINTRDTPAHKQPTLLRVLIQLVLDNDVVDVDYVTTITTKFGIPLTAKKDEGHEVAPEIVPQPPNRPTYLAVITVVSKVADLSPINVNLLDLLIKNNILPKTTVSDIIATFKVTITAPLSPSDVSEGTPIYPSSVTKIIVRGKLIPAQRFITEITKLLTAPGTPTSKQPTLLRILIQLILDNNVVDVKQIKTLTNRFEVTITVDKKEAHEVVPEIPAPSSSESSEEVGHTTPSGTGGTHSHELVIKKPIDSSEIDSDEDTTPVPTLPTPSSHLVVTHGTSSSSEETHDAVKTTSHADVTEGVKTTPPAVVTVGVKTAPQAVVTDTVKTTPRAVVTEGVKTTPQAAVVDDVKTTQRAAVTGGVQTTPSPGETVVRSDVTIGTGKPDKQISFIIQLLKTLVTGKIIDDDTAIRILVTFGIDGKPTFATDQETDEPLTVTDIKDIKIAGSPDAVSKFTTWLIQFLKKKPQPGGDNSQLLKILIEFAIDNSVADQSTITEFAVKYGFTISFKITEVVLPLKVIQVRPANPDGSKDFSDVIITDATSSDASPFINRLIQILVERSILDTPTIKRILVTFKIPGIGPFSKTTGVSSLSKSDVNTIGVRGDSDARKKFIEHIGSLIGKPDNLERSLVKYLLELILDNTLIEIQNAADLAGSYGNSYGFSVSLQVTRIYTQTETEYVPSDSTGSTTTSFDSTVTITNAPSNDDLNAFVNQLLILLIKSNVIDSKVASSILTTYSIKGTGTLANVPGSSLTSSSITSIKFGGNPSAASKFIKLITPTLGQKNKLSSVAVYLLQLLLDNGAVDLQNAAQLAVGFNVAVSIQGRQIRTQTQQQVKPGGDIDD